MDWQFKFGLISLSILYRQQDCARPILDPFIAAGIMSALP